MAIFLDAYAKVLFIIEKSALESAMLFHGLCELVLQWTCADSGSKWDGDDSASSLQRLNKGDASALRRRQGQNSSPYTKITIGSSTSG